MTLAEVMVAFLIFALLASGALTAVVQTRKIAEDNLAQATARTVAQGIIEQVKLTAYSDVADNDPPPCPRCTEPAPHLHLNFIGAKSNNFAAISQPFLPWAASSSDFTDIGALTNPDDLTSPVLGVLIDAKYMAANGTTVIRPARYMPMHASLVRDIDSGHYLVKVVLTYQWQPPSRNRKGRPEVWLTGEIRTIISQAPSY